MSDWSIRRAPTSKRKKLFKKIKAHALEASEKLLILLMSQKVENITVKNILDALFLIHWMIFQNLFQEIEKEINKKIYVSSEIMISRQEKKFLNELWMIKIMKFQIAISRNIVEIMFNNEAEINILLYSVILKLELMIWSNVMIHMKNINNKLLHMIEYIFKVFMWIENVTVW